MIPDCGRRQRVTDYGCYDVVVANPTKTWYQAYDYCADIGRQLINIETEEENTAIKEHLSQNAGKVSQGMLGKLYDRTDSRIEQLYGDRHV